MNGAIAQLFRKLYNYIKDGIPERISMAETLRVVPRMTDEGEVFHERQIHATISLEEYQGSEAAADRSEVVSGVHYALYLFMKELGEASYEDLDELYTALGTWQQFLNDKMALYVRRADDPDDPFSLRAATVEHIIKEWSDMWIESTEGETQLRVNGERSGYWFASVVGQAL